MLPEVHYCTTGEECQYNLNVVYTVLMVLLMVQSTPDHTQSSPLRLLRGLGYWPGIELEHLVASLVGHAI